jgi:hypothetical protein
MNDESPLGATSAYLTDPPTFLGNAEQNPGSQARRAGRIASELGYAGVFYHSRYGHSLENWAIVRTGPCWVIPHSSAELAEIS